MTQTRDPLDALTYPPEIEALADRASADREAAERLLDREPESRDATGRLHVSDTTAEALDRARASATRWAEAVGAFHRRDATGSPHLH